MGNPLSKEIDQHRKDKEYSLAKRGLKEIPKEISRLKVIEKLDFSENEISEIPVEFRTSHLVNDELIKCRQIKDLETVGFDQECFQSFPARLV